MELECSLDVVERIMPEDVAVRLSNICRYAGGVRRFYSVLDHSLFVYRMVCREWPHEDVLQYLALLHDVPEIWMGDIPKPLKGYIVRHLPQVRGIELRILRAIALAFRPSLKDEYDDSVYGWLLRVKRCDELAAIVERDSGFVYVDNVLWYEPGVVRTDCFRVLDRDMAMRLLQDILDMSAEQRIHEYTSILYDLCEHRTGVSNGTQG